MSLAELLEEYDSKLAERFPTAHDARPPEPASGEQLRLAEALYDADLTPELLDMYRFCGNGPRRILGSDFVRQVVRSPAHHYALGGPVPFSAGPFRERSLAVVTMYSKAFCLVTPLEGAHRGHVFRLAFYGEVCCYVSDSIANVVESWLHYLENDYFTLRQNVVVVDGSSEVSEFGEPRFNMLFPAWPDANPLSLSYAYDPGHPEHVEFMRNRVEPYGFDPRVRATHPDHGQYFADNIDRLTDEIRQVEAVFERWGGSTAV